MTLNLKCCVENQSDLFYGNLDRFSNKFPKFIIKLCRNLNKSSIALINYLGNKLIILHVFTCTQSYIYICTRMYTILIYGVHNRIHMNTTKQTMDNLKIDLGLEQGELSFHKKHVSSTMQDEANCKQRIKVLKAKIRKLSKRADN